MFNSRYQQQIAELVQVTQACTRIRNSRSHHPVYQTQGLNDSTEHRHGGTYKDLHDLRPPISFAALCSDYTDTKGMTIQRFRTGRIDCNYPPLPRQIGSKPHYFKTHYRANRDPHVALINPTKYHLLCIIEQKLGIPSYAFSIRQNMFSFTLQPDCVEYDTVYEMGITDRWDSSDVIQSLMIPNLFTLYIRLIKYKYFYGNKKKQRRLNQRLPKCFDLIGADCQ